MTFHHRDFDKKFQTEIKVNGEKLQLNHFIQEFKLITIYIIQAGNFIQLNFSDFHLPISTPHQRHSELCHPEWHFR